MAERRQAGLVPLTAKADRSGFSPFPRMPPSMLRIPARYQPGLVAAASLDADAIARLADALRETPRHLTTQRLAEVVSAAVPELAPESAAEMLEAVLSLIVLPPEDETSVAELARDVAWSPDIELDEAARETFAASLGRLLRLEILVLAARAHDVITDSDQVFHDARILTDIRPVFGVDVASGPRAAVLLAT